MRRRLLHSPLLVLVAALLAPSAHGEEVAPARFETKDGFHTLFIPIVEAKKLQTEWSIVARGSLGGKTIALGVDISLEPPKTTMDTPDVQLKTQGPEGRAFVNALAEKTGVPLAGRSPRDETNFELLILSGSIDKLESNLETTVINLRDDGDYYGEWYLDIDLKRRVLKLSEKNEMYRAPLINSLVREGAPRP